ncbi:MAG TPA: hypothetical protein VJN93_13030 [Candidatus Acidoferrum sp.]|nr:hypothetical protein [Candidatus Acidoferrum sp.]
MRRQNPKNHPRRTAAVVELREGVPEVCGEIASQAVGGGFR